MRALILAIAAALGLAAAGPAMAQPTPAVVVAPDEWEIRRATGGCAVVLFNWTPNRHNLLRRGVGWDGGCDESGLITGAGRLTFSMADNDPNYLTRHSGASAQQGLVFGDVQVSHHSSDYTGAEPEPSNYDRSCMTAMNSGRRIFIFNCNPTRGSALRDAVLGAGGADAFFRQAFDASVSAATIVDETGQCRLEPAAALARFYGEYTSYLNRHPTQMPEARDRGRRTLQARHFVVTHAIGLANAYGPCTGDALTPLRAWMEREVRIIGSSCDWRPQQADPAAPCPPVYPRR